MQEYIPRIVVFPPVNEKVRKILTEHYKIMSANRPLPYQENTRRCIRCGGRDYVENMIENNRKVGSKYYHCRKCYAEKKSYGGKKLG